jgi:hypothetical protein
LWQTAQLKPSDGYIGFGAAAYWQFAESMTISVPGVRVLQLLAILLPRDGGDGIAGGVAEEDGDTVVLDRLRLRRPRYLGWICTQKKIYSIKRFREL